MERDTTKDIVPLVPPVSLSEKVIAELSSYVSPTPGEIPIIAFGNPKLSSNTLSESVVELLRYAGINLMAPCIYDLQNPSTDFPAKVEPLLELAKKHGVRILVRWMDTPSEPTLSAVTCSRLWYDVSSKFDYESCIGGWMLDGGGLPEAVSYDEDLKFGVTITVGGSTMKFVHLQDKWERCAYISMTTSKSFSNATEANNPFIWTGDYASYIQNVATRFKPSVWTNRFYAFHDDIDDGSIRSGYFQNLEIFRRLALYTNRPYWGIIGGVYNSKGKDLDTKYIDIITMRQRLEAHCLLAFGAQGLGWKTFYNDATDDWSPISAYSKKAGTSTNYEVVIEGNAYLFNIAKELNNEISKFSDVFLGGVVSECRFSKNRSRYDGFVIGLSTPLGPLTSLTPASGNQSTYGVLMSHITNAGKEYVVIVNVDTDVSQELSLTFSSPVSQYGLALPAIGTIQNIYLKPGEWAVFSSSTCKEDLLTDSLLSGEPAT